MDVTVVIINGSGEHGKDQFIKFVEHYLKNRVEIFNYSTIDTAKLVGSLLDCPINEKTDKARNLWSAIKDASIEYNDKPSKDTIEFIRNCKNIVSSKPGLIFIHCREPKEIEKIVLNGLLITYKIKTLLIKRPNHTVPLCCKDDPENIFRYNYHQVILNTSLSDLKREAKEFTEKVLN